MKSCRPRPAKPRRVPRIAFLLSITILGLSGCVVIGHGELRAKEAVLNEDLYSMRNAIDQFTQDKHHGPQSLNELVTAGYLRAIPTDPFTRNADWRVVLEDEPRGKHGPLGISDVHSNSSEHGSDGRLYNSW